MLGLNDKSWLVEKFYEKNYEPRISQSHSKNRVEESIYETYFGLGQCVKLIDELGVFKVSPAGLALGNYMQKALFGEKLEGRCLDMGTGSGVLALLLRSMGATDIVATDISPAAVQLARRNEKLNFENNQIHFAVSDLFSTLPKSEKNFDIVIFNPPGWRTPSDHFSSHLQAASGNGGIDLSAMFYGDKVLLQFLSDLPNYLAKDGHAIIGLNSLVGIKDVLTQYKIAQGDLCPLQFRLLERHTFPLLFYSKDWEGIGLHLLEEFARWQELYQSAFSLDSQGNLYWSYELIECMHRSDLRGEAHA